MNYPTSAVSPLRLYALFCAIFALLIAGCSGRSGPSAQQTKCNRILTQAYVFNYDKNYSQSNNVLTSLKNECSDEEIKIAEDSGYYNVAYFLAENNLRLGNSKEALGYFEQALADKRLDIYRRSNALFGKSILLSESDPANANQHIKDAQSIVDKKMGGDLILLNNAKYRNGERTIALLQSYVLIFEDDIWPDSTDYTIPIALATELHQPNVASVLSERQVILRDIESKARAANVPAAGTASGNAALSIQRDTFYAKEYGRLGIPKVTEYYVNDLQKSTNIAQARAVQSQIDAEYAANEQAKSHAENQQILSSLLGIAGSAAVAHVSGGSATEVIKNSAADAVVNMSDNKEMMSALRSGMESMQSSQTAASQKCSHETPDKFKQCCKNVIKGKLSVTNHSDGTVGYGCLHPDKQQTREGCTYSGNKLVGFCAISA